MRQNAETADSAAQVGDGVRIGLIDVDGHNFPNIALMKISAYHKAQGDTVEWCFPLDHYDIVYQSKVFDDTYSDDIDYVPSADKIIRGGTGYGLDNKLPDEIEHIYPDYSIYPELTKDTAYGFLTRGCPRGCHFCIVAEKEGRKSYKVADLSEWWSGQKNIVLCDPNLLAFREHTDLLRQLAESNAWVDINQGVDARLLTKDNIEALNRVKMKDINFAWDYMEQSEKVLQGLKLYSEHGKIQNNRRRIVYTLTNYDTTMEDNLYRIYTLRDLGYEPYVMVYDKPNAPREIKRLQRWCNNRFIFHKVAKFEDYK